MKIFYNEHNKEIKFKNQWNYIIYVLKVLFENDLIYSIPITPIFQYPMDETFSWALENSLNIE